MNNSLFYALLIFVLCLPFSGNMLFAQEYQKDWFANPNRAKYLLTTNGLALKKGEGFYQNIYFLYNSIGLGITDHISISAGVLVYDLFAGNPEYRFNLNPKWSTPVAENFHVGVAGSFFFYLAPRQIISSGALYGIGTYGNSNNNLTIGLGVGYDKKGLSKDPVMSISGQFRVLKNLSVISENWIHPFTSSSYLPSFSIGLRLMLKRMSFDLAYIRLPDINSSGDPRDTRSHLPFISFMLPFGKR